MSNEITEEWNLKNGQWFRLIKGRLYKLNVVYDKWCLVGSQVPADYQVNSHEPSIISTTLFKSVPESNVKDIIDLSYPPDGWALDHSFTVEYASFDYVWVHSSKKFYCCKDGGNWVVWMREGDNLVKVNTIFFDSSCARIWCVSKIAENKRSACGRPTKVNKKIDVMLPAIRCTPEEKEAITAFLIKRGCSYTDLVRQVLFPYVKNNEK